MRESSLRGPQETRTVLTPGTWVCRVASVGLLGRYDAPQHFTLIETELLRPRQGVPAQRDACMRAKSGQRALSTSIPSGVAHEVSAYSRMCRGRYGCTCRASSCRLALIAVRDDGGPVPVMCRQSRSSVGKQAAGPVIRRKVASRPVSADRATSLGQCPRHAQGSWP